MSHTCRAKCLTRSEYNTYLSGLTSVAPFGRVRATLVEPFPRGATILPPWVHSTTIGWFTATILLCPAPILESHRCAVLPRPCALCAPNRCLGRLQTHPHVISAFILSVIDGHCKGLHLLVFLLRCDGSQFTSPFPTLS